MQNACVDRPVHGTHFCLFAYIHIADICLCSGSCCACADYNSGHGRVLTDIIRCSDEAQYTSDGAFGQRKRHDLCAHLRNTEDKVGGSGKTRLCKMGKSLCRKRKVHVRPADVYQAQFRYKSCHKPCRNDRHVQYGGEIRCFGS